MVDLWCRDVFDLETLCATFAGHLLTAPRVTSHESYWKWNLEHSSFQISCQTYGNLTNFYAIRIWKAVYRIEYQLDSAFLIWNINLSHLCPLRQEWTISIRCSTGRLKFMLHKLINRLRLTLGTTHKLWWLSVGLVDLERYVSLTITPKYPKFL